VKVVREGCLLGAGTLSVGVLACAWRSKRLAVRPLGVGHVRGGRRTMPGFCIARGLGAERWERSSSKTASPTVFVGLRPP
jgi:hypothetical protein